MGGKQGEQLPAHWPTSPATYHTGGSQQLGTPSWHRGAAVPVYEGKLTGS